jgi:hypothetical protein
LSLCIWNANGLSHHVEEVKTFIINHNIDILLISKTHFTIKNYSRIPNYAIYITQHPEGKAQGGTAVIIKNSAKHHELNKGPLTITAVYCPPRPVISKAQFEDFYRNLESRFIAGGGYNAKHLRWGSRLVTLRGRQLFMTLEANNLTPDLIDFCV